MTERAPLRAHALMLALLLVAIVVAFWDVIGPARGLFFRDHVLHHKPLLFSIREQLLAGRLPAHGLAGTSGVPIEHLLNGTFTPATLLLLFGAFPVSYDLFVVAHFVILILGVYGLALSLGARAHEAALVAGISTLSGPVLSTENLIPAAQSLSFAPWALWAVHRMLLRPSARNVGALALALGFQAQAILPEVLLLDLFGGLFLLLAVRPRHVGRFFGALLGATVLGLGLAAIALFPALETLEGTLRGQGFGYATQSGWCLSPGHFIDLLVPSFWAPPEVPFVNVAAVTGNADDPPYLVSLFFGTTLLFAIAGLGRGRGLLFAALVFVFIVAMGRHTPVHRVIASLPLLKSSRFAIKWLWLAVPIVATLAVHGLRFFESRPNLLVIASGVQLFTLLSIRITIGYEEFAGWLKEQLPGYGGVAPFQGISPADFPKYALSAMSDRLTFALAFAAAMLVIGLWLAFSRSRPRFLGGLIPALLVAELAFAATFSIRGVEVARQELPGDAARILQNLEQRYFVSTPGNTLPAVHPVEGHTLFEDMMASAGRRARNFHPGTRRYLELNLNAHSNPIHERVFKAAAFAEAGLSRRLLGRAGVAFYTSPRDDEAEERLLAYDVPNEDREHIYRLNARPYVSAYSRWINVASQVIADEDLRALLAAPENQDAAIVFDVDGLASETSTACAVPPLERIDVTPPERIEVAVQLACPAVVVAAEQVMKGWRAEIDGAPARLFNAEAGWLGVHVSKGRHVVRFEYVPLLHRYKWISLVALLVIVALLAIPSKERPIELRLS